VHRGLVTALIQLGPQQFGEGVVGQLGLLQADHIRPALVQPRQQPRQPLLDRVDIPRRYPHPAHSSPASDDFALRQASTRKRPLRGSPMTTPQTSLDERYSQPDATATSWEESRQVLEAAELSWLTTVRPDGRPHQTPVVAVWQDGAVHFCTGIKEQKAVNLSSNPHVLLTTGGLRWNEGLDVVVEGDAVRVSDETELRRLAQAWTTKWDGSWNYEVRDGYFFQPGETFQVLVYRVSPVKVLAFGQGTFTHTVHRF
jgi:nitroimidazol reductase NimA-like FMN-containing flavoprotein (pyridoxamine 5'-phosphate oxidase superfamily)